MMISPIKHDPELCGLDPASSCPRCRPGAERLQRRIVHQERLNILKSRLEAANIDIDDFADLIWMRIESEIEEAVKKTMIETIHLAMKEMRIIGRVEYVYQRR